MALLPSYGGIGRNAEIGAASTSDWVPSKATCLIDQAAVGWGELGPPASASKDNRGLGGRGAAFA